MNDIVLIGSEEVLNSANDPWIENWISTLYLDDNALQAMDSHVRRGFRWVYWCDSLAGRRRDQVMRYHVNVVAQPSKLRGETIDMRFDPANTGWVAISQQTDL